MRFFIHCVSREAGRISRMEKQSFLLEVWRKRTSLLWGWLNERLNWTAWSIFRSKWVGWDRNRNIPHISFGTGVCLERRSCEWARESRPERSRDPLAGVSQGQHWGLCQRERGEVRLEPEEAIDMCTSVEMCVQMLSVCGNICLWVYLRMEDSMYRSVWEYLNICDSENTSVCLCVWLCMRRCECVCV